MQFPKNLVVGAVVENFGAIVRVEALDAERGVLVRVIPWFDGARSQGGVGQRFFADPSKCRVVPVPADAQALRLR
jgi:hypothetical protein